MAGYPNRRAGGRKPGPKNNKNLYWRVEKGKKDAPLEILLLGLFFVCIGVLFFLVFFGG